MNFHCNCHIEKVATLQEQRLKSRQTRGSELLWALPASQEQFFAG
jgi:hypothetical protein